MSDSLQTRHPRTPRPVNVSYLVMGLVFLGIAGSWALRAGGVVDTSQMQWLVPVVLVGAGVIGLVAFTARGLRRGQRGPDNGTYGDTRADDADHTGSFDPYPPYAPADVPADVPADTEQTTRIEGETR